MGAHSVASYRKEIEDFCNTLRTLGYREADFGLQYVQWPTTARHTSAPNGLIIVTRQREKIKKAYAADATATWLHTFDKDLRAGVFDTPPCQPATTYT